MGIEIDPDYAGLARSACSQVIVGDMEDMDERTFATLAATECWVFGDTLEHFRDPWAV